MNIEGLDYNTQREKLALPEYGREIQRMVDHAKTLPDKKERQRCAQTIVAIMAKMKNKSSDEAEFKKKLWNHLAAMADYELDIDYPYEIEKMSDRSSDRQRIAYPQHPIGKRHYGAIIEALAKKLTEIEDADEREQLTRMVANQMKRSLGRWNKDSMSEEKVLDDLATLTNGKASYLEVLTAQESLLNAQLNEAMNLYDGSQALIALYIALGGGSK